MKYITFSDHPEFTPNLTPREMFLLGSFGGTYWRPIYSSVTGKSYTDQWKEFPFLIDIKDPNLMTLPYNEYNKDINRFKVRVGTTLEYWEKKGWIHPQDPYGWVQWYCRFYMGRRSPDDDRQIKRWIQIKNRFKGQNSLAVKQTMQHWAILL